MAATQDTPDDVPPSPANYAPGTGRERYIRFIEDWLDVTLSEVQREIAISVAENRYTHVEGANGYGKSFISACLIGAYLFCNQDSTVNATSGSYSTLNDTLWKPLKSLHKHAQNTHGLPGERIESPPTLRTTFHPEWYFKAISPRWPDDLEGRHNDRMFYVIEEADKPGITAEHIDSAESTITDGEDRMLVIGNPPKDEGNVAYDLAESDKWHTLRYSSFDSHNVRVDAGELDAERLPGLVSLPKVAENWEDWNNEEWPAAAETYDGEYPGVADLLERVDSDTDEFSREDLLAVLRPGFETAKHAHEDRTDLDERWYRRRAGVMPPQGADIHRPFHVPDVRLATNRQPERGALRGVGFDIARDGGDSSACVKYYEGELHAEVWQVSDAKGHGGNRERIHDILSTDGEHRQAPVAVDAIGEGSDIADMVRTEYDGVRFKAGTVAEDEENYASKWAEGLARLGDALDDVTFTGPNADRLRKEMFAAARCVRYERKATKKHEQYTATSKAEIKEQYGQSPDLLDAALMAVWVADSSEADTDVLAFQL